ncbi:MAG: hypothetical protein K6E22_01485 [Treponema sp.]|nr:hypothetical protein [Treponema sp.]
MREDNITQKLIEYKKNDTDKSFMDQNALNAILGEKCLWISPKFNMMATCSPETIYELLKTENSIQSIANFYEIPESEMQSAWKAPAILHVTSETKAWKNMNAAQIDEWLEYSLPDDSLKVAKNYCVSLKNDIEKQQNDFYIKVYEQISNLQQQLNQTYSLLVNTRHRTLYGACAWVFNKIFRHNKK